MKVWNPRLGAFAGTAVAATEATELEREKGKGKERSVEGKENDEDEDGFPHTADAEATEDTLNAAAEA